MTSPFSSGTWRVLSATVALLTAAVPIAYSADIVRDSAAIVADRSQFHQGQWPFFPPVRPALPEVADLASWANPIDRFIAVRLAEFGLQPTPAADKGTLLRRVTYDLTGLPPTPAELDDFLADDSDDAYERVVDRLLASPRFGERWAQHWLDLVRFAETEGFKADGLRKNAFRYRDYVIESFNHDRPFDEFVRQQLAGDELEPDNPEALVATGFLRLYPDEDNAANLFQRRQEILNDVTDTTGLVFLGLTMGCAQCHDHKFDEILQTDYYRLQAFFVSMTERDDVPFAEPADRSAYEAECARWEEATAPVRSEITRLTEPAREALERYQLEKYEPAIAACYTKPENERSPYEQLIARMIQWRMELSITDDGIAKKLAKVDRKRLADLQQRLTTFDSLKPRALPGIMCVADVGGEAPPTHLLSGGSWKQPDVLVEPGFPEFLGATAPQNVASTALERRLPSTGRRTQLAQWLTRPDHPLTSRVIVNRLWQHHFGRGIVGTSNDLGMQGDRPTHPELLDWLAVELVEHQWSLKHIHRLMVTSAAYRRSSTIEPNAADSLHALEFDRANRLLWRANRRRLEGEAIRDAMLQLAGELNLTMYGSSARPKLPDGVSERYAWEPEKDITQRNRRSIYVFAKRNMRFPLFEVFDQPDLHQSCACRAETITASQSLTMLNSELALELARGWAERLVAEFGDERGPLIQHAYRAAYGRPASDEELNLAKSFLADLDPFDAEPVDSDPSRTDASAQAAEQSSELNIGAVADFCHALFNSNEFITID